MRIDARNGANVDGCKVTVRYSGHKNPDAIRGIKEILLTNIAKKA